MEVKQIYELLNNVNKEVLGESAVIKEDLSNITDIGTTVFDSTSVDNYVKSLVDHIGKTIFVNREYLGNAPSVLMDGWEYGSVLQKITADIPDATENKEWDLQNGVSYDVNVFVKPTAESKFFNKRVTFEIDMSFPENQVKSAFTNAEQMNGFISMIRSNIQKSMTLKTDALIMRTINNMTAQTIYNAFGAVDSDADYSDKNAVRAVNLLKSYNDIFGAGLTVEKALTDKDFIRYASYSISLYKDRLSKMSKLFNIGGKSRFTPSDDLHIVLLSEFAESANVYLSSDTYHNELVKLPNYETVPYWQGSGESYAFADVSKIDVSTQNPTADGVVDVSIGGIIGVMFDRDALGVTNIDNAVTSQYNAKGRFLNEFYHYTSGYFNDTNENFIVFFVA